MIVKQSERNAGEQQRQRYCYRDGGFAKNTHVQMKNHCNLESMNRLAGRFIRVPYILYGNSLHIFHCSWYYEWKITPIEWRNRILPIWTLLRLHTDTMYCSSMYQVVKCP